MNAESVVYGIVLIGLFGFAMKWAFTAKTNGFDERLKSLLENDAKPAAHKVPMSKIHRERLLKQTLTNTANSGSIHYRMKNDPLRTRR